MSKLTPITRGAARILPFRRPAAAPAVSAPARNWSAQEMADFYRAHRLLSLNGVAIGLDRGQSDVGDPWMVFYDTNTEDVFLHIARFDSQCVLVCDTLGLKLSHPTIADLVVAFEDAVRDFVTIRQERSANVLLHPAARIIMSISAVFLLFKLESGGTAHAKVVVDPVAADASRKQDTGAPARLHQAFARIFDIADAPAAAAAIAGAILSVELARNNLSADHATSEPLGFTHEDRHAEAVAIHPDSAGPAPSPNDLAASVPAHASLQATPVPQLSSDAAIHVAISPILLVAEQGAPHADQTPLPFSAAQGPAQADLHASSSGGNPAYSATPPSTAAETAITVAEAATSPQEPPASVTLAATAVQTLLDATALLGTPTPLPVEASNAFAPAVSGDITVAALPALDAVVALSCETALTGALLADTIIDFMTRLGSYDVEIAGGTVLIEQRDASSLSTDLLGIWTNVMDDGSAISVVGHIDLVADVTAGLA